MTGLARATLALVRVAVWTNLLLVGIEMEMMP